MSEDRYQWASDLQEDLMRFLLAGDAIYSSKHLSGYMKEAFAEDIVREAEKMERYASIERPEQIETTGVTGELSRSQRRQQSLPAMPVAGRTPTAQAQPAVSSGYVPPATDDELAELDGAADKTQIFDPSLVVPRPGSSGPGASASVLVDDSLTGETSYPSADDPQPSARDRVRGGRQQVVIGEEEGEGYAGATVVGPAPTARPAPEPQESNATRVGQIESGSTMLSPMPTGQRRRLIRDEEQDSSQHEPEQDEQHLSEEEPPDEYGDQHSSGEADDPQEEETTGPIALPQEEEAEAPAPQKSKPTPQKKAPRAAATGKKLPPKAVIGIAAGAVLLVLVVLGAVLFSGPNTGSVMISVQPAQGAEVRIDGKLVAQNQVIELLEGAHKLTATAPGHLLSEQVVTVTKGQRAQVLTVALEAEPPPDQPDKPAENDTQVASATGTGTGTGTQEGTPSDSQPEERAPTQEPATQTAAATGSSPETGTGTQPAPVEPPKPTTFEAVFVGDAGAEIQVGGKSVGKTPDAKLANLTIGKTYAFTVTRAGYKRYSGKFRSEGETEVQVSFELEKEEPAPERTVSRQPSPEKSTRSSSRSLAKGKLACSSPSSRCPDLGGRQEYRPPDARGARQSAAPPGGQPHRRLQARRQTEQAPEGQHLRGGCGQAHQHPARVITHSLPSFQCWVKRDLHPGARFRDLVPFKVDRHDDDAHPRQGRLGRTRRAALLLSAPP